MFLLIFAWSTAFLWLAALLWTAYCLEKTKTLALRKTSKNRLKPLVSIVVPARDEARRVLDKSLRSMLAQTYENLEIIVVDDRSVDDTKKIIETVFAEQSENRNLKSAIIVDGIEPPAGWLGKPFALEQGLKHARGEWILTADADIIFAPDALRTAVEYALANDFDALTLQPKLLLASFWETLFMPTFAWFCLLAMPLHRANDPRKKESVGYGNFFLMRRGVLDAVSGFYTVKSDVAEDLRLAEIIKEASFKLRADYAPELIETRMYAGFAEIWHGFTKNLFSGMKFSLVKTVFSVVSIFAFGVLPSILAFASIVFGQFAFFAPFFTIYLLQTAIFVSVQKKWRGNRLFAFLTPLGLLIFLLILANSTVKILSGNGVVWKGRGIYENGKRGKRLKSSGK